MKMKFLIVLAALSGMIFSQNPCTVSAPVIDTYFDTQVSDPFRCLEDLDSPTTKSWIAHQNIETQNYLQRIPFRDAVSKRLEKAFDSPKETAPFEEGNYIYFYANSGKQNQDVLYRYPKEGKKEDAEVFLDPNLFSADGTTSLAQLAFSQDGGKLAYAISEGGSDWRTILFMNADGESLPDTLRNAKFTALEWHENQGVFYSKYKVEEGNALTQKNTNHQLFFHKLGTSQDKDELIFSGDYRYVQGGVTEDQNYLVVQAANRTSGNRLFVKDLRKPKSKFITLDDDIMTDTYLIFNTKKTFYLHTKKDAPNGRVVKTDLNKIMFEPWQDVIPETEQTMTAYESGAYILTHYLADATSRVVQYQKNGKRVREIDLPGPGTASGLGAKSKKEHDYFYFSDYITPTSIYKLDLQSGAYETYWRPINTFDSELYTSEKVFYKGTDGAKIPMIISYKKGLKKDGKNPTWLYGYGGFNISITPRFSAQMAVWMDLGGVFAVANIRGGGEYGKKWHDAGRKMNKKTVFTDFISAGEYLIQNQYTQTDKLAIEGRSNGGLLVGACMTMRPDLFAVALPGVGVLDMLRYHTFTAGAGWAYDYGTAEESQEMFDYLYRYSPLHNVKKDTNYPATMVTTGDHDDRVVPSHSFKFAAELQSKQAGENPVLIRIDTNAGHGAGKPLDLQIAEWADKISFTLYNMGIQEINK